MKSLRLLQFSIVALLLWTEPASAIVQIPFLNPSCLFNPGSYACGRREGPLSALFANACPDDRWLGYRLSASQCTAPGTSSTGVWSVSALFTAPVAGLIPTVLQRFCIYEWTPAAGTSNPPLISLLPNIPGIRLERDCQVVTPLLTPTPQTSDLLQTAYDTQIDRPVFPLNTVVPDQVRVAVIDTSADEDTSGLPSGDADTHGLAVGSLIHRNACFRGPGGEELGCAAYVTSHRAIGPESGDRPAFGFQSELARAIFRAVRSFQDQGAQEHLIINLSLGWDTGWGTLNLSQIRLSTLAAWLAAEWAACEGALVIAAAGNSSSVDSPSGPMAPGAWESQKRLCTQLLAYDPPVFAVGGVDGADRALGNGREDGHPRLVAPSAYVTADLRDPATGLVVGSTPILSGTSLSAAGVSGVAAMAWALNPQLNAVQLMEKLTSAGMSLGASPDFQTPPWLWTKRRLDACAAIEEVNPPAGSAPLACTPRAAGVDASIDLTALLDSQWPNLTSSPPCPGCVAETSFTTEPAVDGSSDPNGSPQPGKPTCSLCGVATQNFSGGIDLDTGTTFQQMILYPSICEMPWCDPNKGGISISISDPAQPFRVSLPGFPSSVDRAVVEIRVRRYTETIVMMSPVMIEQ